MRAALIHGVRDLRVVDLPIPEPGDDEVLVRVMAYAPYGTDIGHYLNRDGRYARVYPFGVGADFSGVVERAGARADHLRPGTRVTALALNHCGACDYCRRGITNLCENPVALARPRQAACQDYTIVAANKIAAMPDNVSFEEGAMLAGSVVALNAFELMGLQPGDKLAVVGVGAIGLNVVATARACGIGTIAIGGTGKRADIARALGASEVIRLAHHGELVTDAALAHAPGGFSHVIETTCTDWGLQQAIAIAGRMAQIGITGGGQMPDCAWDIVLRQLRLVGVSCGHHQEHALELISMGKLDMKPAISARFPLERAPEAFALLAGRDSADVGRVIISIGEAGSEARSASQTVASI